MEFIKKFENFVMINESLNLELLKALKPFELGKMETKFKQEEFELNKTNNPNLSDEDNINKIIQELEQDLELYKEHTQPFMILNKDKSAKFYTKDFKFLKEVKPLYDKFGNFSSKVLKTIEDLGISKERTITSETVNDFRLDKARGVKIANYLKDPEKIKMLNSLFKK